MEKKAFPLQNKGMNRDLSISKAGESSAYENRNIRIIATDSDTLLSVTNERGTKEIPLTGFVPMDSSCLLGWNVLNEHLILFIRYTHRVMGQPATFYDRIYRIDYDSSQVLLENQFSYELLFSGDLNFNFSNPIESVVYYESDDIQKIYWVDGRNVLRFMNFMAKKDDNGYYPWQTGADTYDNTYFDSNREVNFGVSVDISKDNAGNTRANGTVQYFLTYYNKFGQESGYVWASGLVYLSPLDSGGAADGYNNNKVILNVTGLDSRFSYFRIYSLFRSSLDGQPVSYLVSEQKVPDDNTESVIVIDDNAHLTVQDTSHLLYLGSQSVIPGTLEHKDQTLFLGDLVLEDKAALRSIEEAIKDNMFDEDGVTSNAIAFDYSEASSSSDIADIPYVDNSGNYPYNNQLQLTSSQITSFKGGEKYRFALRFKLQDGSDTDAFWIGDAENDKYPVIDVTRHRIRRVIVRCAIPSEVVSAICTSDLNIKAVQLMMAEVTDADRSVKAQGIVNPTMFNTWERYQDRVYSYPSWLSRSRGGDHAWKHFTPVHNANLSTGEIQCNWWDGDSTPVPYYRYKNYDTNPTYTETFPASGGFEKLMLVYKLEYLGTLEYKCTLYIITGSQVESSTDPTHVLSSYSISTSSAFDDWTKYTSSDPEEKQGWRHFEDKVGSTTYIQLDEYTFVSQHSRWGHGKSRYAIYCDIEDKLLELGLDDYCIGYSTFNKWCAKAYDEYTCIVNQSLYGLTGYSNYYYVLSNALNAVKSGETNPGSERWRDNGDYTVVGNNGGRTPSFQKKHLMFVDENVVTLDSPELEQGWSSSDNAELNFRIIGAAKMSSVISDFTIDATKNAFSGSNYDQENFSGSIPNRTYIYGISAWPLWKDYGLTPNNSGQSKEKNQRTPSDYDQIKNNVVRYWMYLWNHVGNISSFTTGDNDEIYSNLNTKTFANLRYSYNTVYLATPFVFAYGTDDQTPGIDTIRMAVDGGASLLALKVGEDRRNYAGRPQLSLTTPGIVKYPLYYSTKREDNTDKISYPDDYYLLSQSPVQIEYGTRNHAVISLKSCSNWHSGSDTKSYYMQDLLPYFFDEEKTDIPENGIIDEGGVDVKISGALIPWKEEVASYDYIQQTSSTEFPVMTVTDYSAVTSSVSLRYQANSVTDFPVYLKALTEGIACFSKNTQVYTRFIGSDGAVYVVGLNSLQYSSKEYITRYGTCVIELQNAPVIVRLTSTDDDITLSINSVAVTFTIPTGEHNPRIITNGPNAETLTVYENTYSSVDYPYTDYYARQEKISAAPNDSIYSDIIHDYDDYLFVGEIYRDFSTNDTRYGGTSDSAIRNNRFIPAGPITSVETWSENTSYEIHGNQGDTYIQRWDSLRVKPYSNDSANQVIDITSVMLETHINLDGRTDLQRGINELASIDTTTFGQINTAYSQTDDFIVARDLDEKFDEDSYRSSITWSLEKSDMADIDEWTHVTLGTNLKLDGDKGFCRAIRRWKNTLLAFQDKGLSEILFNSRTQLSTEEGVPVEIANSGKVDGKRYITNKNGCLNKWSIVEGKAGLYFVDNIAKAFCKYYRDYRSEGVQDISTSKGFGVWFRKHNMMTPWNPFDHRNFVSFYDNIHSDIYLSTIKESSNQYPTVVYNELLDTFTSFYDYQEVDMMVNFKDRFVSFSNKKLWLQNEGLYGVFYGTAYPFSVQYRATPDPYGDKIWTNVEYRADVYQTLDANGDEQYRFEQGGLDMEAAYQPNVTFDYMKFWNEYQTTAAEADYHGAPVKKFRAWRMDIPRAAQDAAHNKYGLNRIRNPWINILFKKNYRQGTADNQNLMQIHDAAVIYFE